MNETGFGGFRLVIHKGEIEKIPFSVLLQMAGRSNVVFSNDVYIIIDVKSVEPCDDSIKSYYANAKSCRTPSENIKQSASPRFCQYVGDNTSIAETYFQRKIYVDSQDVSLAPHLMFEGRWEQWVTDFLWRELSPGDVFIDIGANVGFFSILAAHLVGPSGFVLAVEPQQRLASMIERSFSVNGFMEYCCVEQCAIGEQNRTADLILKGRCTGNATLMPDLDNDKTGSETVRVRTLPEILSRCGGELGKTVIPTMIKMDIEGFEYAAWLGMYDFLRQTDTLTMIVEYAPNRYREQGQNPEAFLDSIKDAGFTVTQLDHQSRERSFERSSIEQLASCNGYADIILRKPT